MPVTVRSIIALGALLGAHAVSAETLTVEGVYPAGNSEAAALESIAVEPLGGVDGGGLATMIGDRLRNVAIEGAPWLRVYSGSLASDAEAALSGFVSTSVQIDESYSKEVSRCVKRDEDRKCIEKVKEEIPCDRARIRVSPSLRLISRDGQLIHSDNEAVAREIRFCADENQPSLDPLVEQALAQIADRVRFDLAPHFRREDIRVLESRKGMDRELGREFRSAIRLTKNDELGACYAFSSLEDQIGSHRSLLFNLGLCAESAGELDKAEDYYRRTLAVDSGTDYASAGLSRIEQRRIAFDQLRQRSNEQADID